MNNSFCIRIFACLSIALLAGCSWIVDEAAGFPASHVIRDVRSTSAEYEKEQQEKRVEELNREYEEFVRSGEPCVVKSTDRTSSIEVDQTNSLESACIPSNDIPSTE